MKATNPRTGKVDYAFDAISPADVASEAERLRAAQPAWEALGPEGRAERLRALADAIETRADAIVDRLAVDTGRTTVARIEVDGLVRSLRGWADRAPGLFAALPKERAPSATPGVEIEPRWSAYLLFGAIAPWNFPVVLSHIDAVPALAAGCAALVKPSEVTPRFVEPMREAFGCGARNPFRLCSGRGGNGARAGRGGGLCLLHRLDRDRAGGGRSGGAAADPGQSRAGRQGSDDRDRLRRSRMGRADRAARLRRRDRAGLPVDRAYLCRARRSRGRSSTRLGPRSRRRSRWRWTASWRPWPVHPPAAGRHWSPPRSPMRGNQGRARADRRDG